MSARVSLTTSRSKTRCFALANVIDVSILKHRLGSASLGNFEHSKAYALRCCHILWEKPLQYWIERAQDRVDDTVPLSLRPNPVQRLDECRTKHVRSAERHLQQRILCFAFHPGPHHAPSLRAIGARARNVDECHCRVEPG